MAGERSASRALAEAIVRGEIPVGRAALSARPKPSGVPAPCGTRAAAMRHYRRREQLDEACRAACRAYHKAARRGGAPDAAVASPTEMET